MGARRLRVVGMTTEIKMTGGEPFLCMRMDDAKDLLFDGRDLVSSILLRGRAIDVPGFYAQTPQ